MSSCLSLFGELSGDPHLKGPDDLRGPESGVPLGGKYSQRTPLQQHPQCEPAASSGALEWGQREPKVKCHHWLPRQPSGLTDMGVRCMNLCP